MFQVSSDLGWVDIDLSHSTVSLVLLGQMGIWLNWLGSWTKWWNIKVNPTHVTDHQPHPVLKRNSYFNVNKRLSMTR